MRTPGPALSLSVAAVLWGCGGTSDAPRSGQTPGDALATPSVALESTASPTATTTPPLPSGTGPLLQPSQPVGPIALGDLPRYDIDQAIDDVGGTFAGHESVSFENPTGKPLEVVPLLLHPNAHEELGGPHGGSGSIRVASVSTPTGSALTYTSLRPTLVEVKLAVPVAPGERVELVVAYDGRLRTLPPSSNDMFSQALSSLGAFSGGGGDSDYGLLAVGDGLCTTSSAYPMVAPYRDGAFDTHPPARMGDLAYNGVSNFRVRTVLPPGVHMVSNLVDSAPSTLPNGGLAVTSEGDLVRDFVLVAGRDLEAESTMHGATRVTSVHRARDARAGKAVLDAATAALAAFEKRFGPYPYRELDVAEATLVGGAGGVEFSGMVLIAGMLYRSPTESGSQLAELMKLWGRLGGGLGGLPAAPGSTEASPDGLGNMLDTMLEFTVAHEVAHQYFAGIVGNDSYRFPSLDEPAAQYAASLAVQDAHGAAAAQKAMDGNVKLNYALYRMLGGPDRPVLRDTSSFRTAVEYAALVYGKAPYAYVELERRLGATRLQDAMRAAIERHRFQVVSTEAWIGAIEDAAGGPPSGVRGVFRRYLEETHGDEDLGVDASGRFVIDTVFPPEMATALHQATVSLGMDPAALLRMLFGGGLGDDAPVGPGLDPLEALRQLRDLR